MVANNGSARKFYILPEEWERERANLAFLARIQNAGFDIGCKIPAVLDSGGEGQWEINGTTYVRYRDMELIAGMPASLGIETKALEQFGNDLGTILFTFHTRSRAYIPEWTSRFGQKDALLRHILEDKARRVEQEEADPAIRRGIKHAATYLKDRVVSFSPGSTLSHTDLNLSNILINDGGTVKGLVDWGSFGLTNPTLSMYQLATKTRVWPHIKRRYEDLGGHVAYDVLYAAAFIHLAWAPLICRELGQELSEDESRQRLEEMYEKFESSVAA